MACRSSSVLLNGLFYDANNPGYSFDFNVHEFDVPFELQMFEVIDGVFGAPVANETRWGTITITMTDCESGHASFDGLDGVLEMDLTRLSGVPGIECQIN